MFIGLLKRFLKNTATIIAGTSVLLLIGIAEVQAAKPPPVPLSCSIAPVDGSTTTGVAITFTASTQGGKGGKSYSWDFSDGPGTPSTSTSNPVSVTYNNTGTFDVLLDVADSKGGQACCTTTVTVNGGGGNQAPVLGPIGDKTVSAGNDLTFTVTASDGDGDSLIISATNLPAGSSFTDNNDGTGDFEWLNASPAGSTSTTFTVSDGVLADDDSEQILITVIDVPPPPTFAAQTDFKIMMNYELGMHCTGFEFAYCCVLPAYNSILAQVVKPNQSAAQHGGDFPMLMAGDPNEGLDALGRETVVRDKSELDGNGNFKKYVLEYWHDAQPRNDGRGKVQTSTLISAAEGNSLMSWNTTFDGATVDPVTKELVIGGYNGSTGVMQGNGTLGEAGDNYQNAVWNHLYFYDNLEGDNTKGPGGTASSLGIHKTRLGVNGQVVFPTDCGAALHPMGPVTTDENGDTVANDCGGFSNGNVLTFSGDKGTVVYTQMKVLENLPVMLTSPDIWEALGLPLTPFEDSVDFFSDPGLLNEDSVRPFVAMNAKMYDYDPNGPSGKGSATLDSNGDPVIGFGTAPIDIPNCERCHSNGPNGSFVDIPDSESAGVIDADPDTLGVQLEVINSPNGDSAQYALVQQEYNFWNAYYDIDKAAGDSDWYSRLKSAAISMLNGHDIQHGTSFVANYPGCIDSTNPSSDCGATPQNTRLGHESVICQRCHADNVIAAVKSATHNGVTIKPVTEAIHNNHRGINMADANGVGGPITFADSLGRDGGCQGCHPAHRSDGDMDGYPITLAGSNRYAGGDNRGANGGCFVGRDVHSNPGKDTDGAETPEHLNAVGQYLADNVASDGNGIWCTNCHNQLGQEMWKAENMVSLVHGVPGKEADGVTDAVNIRALPDLASIAAAVGTTEAQAMSWLDPKEGLAPGDDDSYAIWATDPGLCDYVDNVLIGGQPANPAHDGNVATIEVHAGGTCSTGYVDGPNLATAFGCNTPATLCGTFDGDGDFSVHAMDFCTTPDCVAAAQAVLDADLQATNALAVPVPMSAATDGRDHWLSPGEPHCADCHAAPFVEQSGNINAYPPFNYPRKASLMRYSKGHQNISCQGCHESIHGLYPVTPNIDTTTYAQAAALNHDGSHGPLKCGTCHDVDNQGIPNFMNANRTVYSVPGYGANGINSYDEAVAWAHMYTEEQSVLDTTCQNCHGVQGTNWSDMGSYNNPDEKFVEHTMDGRGSRQMQDKAEIERWGAVLTSSNGADGVCTECHGNEANNVSCNDSEWQSHLTEGRVAAETFEKISTVLTGDTCW